VAQINLMVDSEGLFIPLSIFATAGPETPIASPNFACDKSRAFLTSFILSFMLSPPFDSSIHQFRN
jgi:hypothetical protein